MSAQLCSAVRQRYGEDDEALHAIAVGGAAWRNRPHGGSIELTTTRLLTSSSVTTRAALENAASVALASPMSLSQSKTMLLGMWSKSCGAPGLIASLASVIAGSGSYSTSIASAASRAAVKV